MYENVSDFGLRSNQGKDSLCNVLNGLLSLFKPLPLGQSQSPGAVDFEGIQGASQTAESPHDVVLEARDRGYLQQDFCRPGMTPLFGFPPYLTCQVELDDKLECNHQAEARSHTPPTLFPS